MIRIFTIAIIMAMVSVFSMQAHADLNLIGQGTSVDGTYNLIYDTDLDITWYDYTKSNQNWQTQVDWADALDVNFGGIHYTDWRLPITVDGLAVWGYDGTTTAGHNITSSEMGHLYFTELGNDGYFDTSGNLTGCSTSSPYCLTNTGDFQNLIANSYWTGTEYSTSPSYAWWFMTEYGVQNANTPKDVGMYAIAVRDGLAVLPEPISSILFVTGGATLGFRRYWKRKRERIGKYIY